MWYDAMFLEMESLANIEQATKMSAYMQNKFPFLGIPKPQLNELIKPYLKNAPKAKAIDWDFVKICWEKDYREAQYVAIEYLKRNVKALVESDLDELKYLIVTKSWWETIDSIDAYVGELALKYPSVKEEMYQWSTADNIWLRRVSLDF